MKIITNKFKDSFYLPIKNNSCLENASYQVTVDDPYGLISIPNTFGPGPSNKIFITAPKVPSLRIESTTLAAKKIDNSYYLTIFPSDSRFKSYPLGKKFYLFLFTGFYSGVSVDFYGYDNSTSPLFLISESSLKKILPAGQGLPTTSSPYTFTGTFYISTDSETSNFLNVITNTTVKTLQTSKVFIKNDSSFYEYDFTVDPKDSPVSSVEQPPSNKYEKKTSQLLRSFIPISSTVSLQLDSNGHLFMDTLKSGDSNSQLSYRKRCTNLGFEKDIASFCAEIPKGSLYSFSDEEITSSTTQFSEQYFTDVNLGVSINRSTPEKLRCFAPLWLKDKVPNYFLVFRKHALLETADLLKDATLVSAIDIHKSELGGYLEKLVKSPNFSLAPLEVAIDNSYALTWNGVSLETGYWVNHKEFIDIDIQQGLSDFEFNEIISGGFSRGLIVNPQFLNIEFLFNDNSADPYNVYQYFGLYSDEIEISSFLPNVKATQTLFNQSETRSSSNADYNNSIITNPNGVKLAVNLNNDPDKIFISRDSGKILTDSSGYVQSRYSIKDLIVSQGSMSFSFSSDIDLTQISGTLSPQKILRLEDSLHQFVTYLEIKSCTYNSEQKRLTVNVQDSIELLNLSSSDLWINIFDLYTGTNGVLGLDSSVQEFSKCLVISKTDALGNSITEWLNNVVDQGEKIKDAIILFDKSSGSYLISLADSLVEETNYFKVFLTVLESKGTLNPGGDIFVHISEYDIDGSIPGPKIINSQSRKFTLKTKNELYSVKNFNLINDQNNILGEFELDSTSFNLGQIIGMSSDSSVPVRMLDSFYAGLELNLQDFSRTPFELGDRIVVEEINAKTTRRWTVIKGESAPKEVSTIPGTVTEIEILSMVSNNQYTEVTISAGDYTPSRFDLFCIKGSATSPDLLVDFLRAEANDSGTYTIIFGNPDIKIDYQTLQVGIEESNITYFNYDSQDSISSNIAVAFQRFVDFPLKTSVNSGKLYLYTGETKSEFSIKVFAAPGMINRFEFNGAYQKPVTVLRNDELILNDFFSYHIFPTSNEKVYSIDSSFIEKLREGSQILSKSGSPSKISNWDNGTYSIPDIKAIVEQGENRVLIKFDKDNEPSLLNDRLQLFNFNNLKLSMLSFYDVVDLDLFDEIPERSLQAEENFVKGTSVYQEETPLFDPNISKQKNFYLTVNVVENIFERWKDWDPVNGPNFYFELPLTFDLSSKFKVEYLDADGNWKNYPIQINPLKITPTGINGFFGSTSNLYDGNISLVFGRNDNQSSIQVLQDLIDAYVLAINEVKRSDPSNSLLLIGALKGLVSFLYLNFQTSLFTASANSNPIAVQNTSPYLYSQGFTLNVNNTTKNFRYSTSLVENTYTIKEQTLYDDFIGFGGATKTNRTINFIGSLDKSTGKVKPKVGRWRERASTNVDGTPYLLNVDPLMPPYDLFVNASQENPAPENFSFDWYLVSGWPKSTDLSDFKQNYRYLGKRVDQSLLQSLEYDYFTEYFTIGKGLEKTLDGQERGRDSLWTEITNSPDGFKTTFRGFPLIFRTDLNLEGVKFAAVLQINEELEKPSKISLVYNQKWRAITLLVELNANNYTIDQSISISDLYSLQTSKANSDVSSVLYSPVFIIKSDSLQFDMSERIYNVETEQITNIPVDPSTNNYEYNGYSFIKREETRYDETRQDIELFGVDYIPNSDYLIKGDIFFGTAKKSTVTLTIPKSRIRGVFDTNLQKYRVFIDQVFDDSFFAVLSDIETGPTLIYAKFSKRNLINFNGEDTSISNASVYACGENLAYVDYFKKISAGSVINSLYNGDFTDISISREGNISKSGIEFSSKAPSVIRPLFFNRAALNSEGFTYFVKEENNSNLFRLDGAFEPSYDRIVDYAAAEDLTLTRQALDSFNGANTQIINVNDIFLWYTRVSSFGVNSGFINMNGETIRFSYPLGRRNISPMKNTWSDDFYLSAVDEYVDVSNSGFDDIMDHKFFFSSKSMSVPSYFRTTDFSISNLEESEDIRSSVNWKKVGERLTISIDFNRIIESYLFNSGVFAYFQSIEEELKTERTIYDLTKEYINKNLLDRYYPVSIEVYSKPDTITQVISTQDNPEINGFSKIDTIDIQSRRYFEFSVPVDKSQQISLAFNIKRT